MDFSLLHLRNATVRFGNITALDRVNFTVNNKEIIGLLGSNGAGKSTLVKTLIGFHRLDKGELYFEGVKADFDSPLDARKNGIETVFQNLSLADDLSIARNFFIGKELLRRVGPFTYPDGKRMHTTAMETLRELGFEANVNRDDPVGSLSGGERQLIAIARANFFARKLLILDEPFSALSELSVQSVIGLIKKTKARGISVLLVTHHAPEVFDLADRFVVLQNGRIQAELRKEDTDIKDLEKLLISQRLTVVKEMAAGVAHQIRNPLGVMKVSVDMLKRKFRVEDAQDNYNRVVDVLSTEIENLNHIIVNYLDFAHQTKIEKKLCSAAELIESSLASIPKRKYGRIKVHTEVPDRMAAYLLDPNLLKQAISNLIINGIEASSGQGNVAVRALIRHRQLIIEVQDWGCGMDEETVKKIFNPFFSTKSSGTGLGLSIAHRVVELHGGRIEVETASLKGTIFRIVI